MRDSVGIIEGIEPRKSGGQDAVMLGEFLKMANVKRDICMVYEYRISKLIFLKKFLDSDYRFLHVSAHGGRMCLGLEDKEKTEVTIKDIQKYCRKRKSRTNQHRPLHKPLYRKFVTISSCGHVSADFVMELHKHTGSTAVISALAPVDFDESALFFSLFYFSLFKCLEDAKESASEESRKLSLSERVALYVDAYQRAKNSYLGIGGNGAHRLDYWWNAKHVIVN